MSCGGKSSSPTSPAPANLELNSGNIAGNGGVYQHTFRTAGTYNYYCVFHDMPGSVTVVTSGSPTIDTIVVVNYGFNPLATQIDTGGTVTWTNNSGTIHTVTSH